jgi:hypothetical protein
MTDNILREATRKSCDSLEHRKQDGGKQLRDALFKKKKSVSLLYLPYPDEVVP